MFHKNIRNFGFSLTFVTKLYRQCKPDKKSPNDGQAEVLSLYKELVTALVDVLRISALRSAEALQAQQDIATKAARSSFPYASYVSSQHTAPAPSREELLSAVDARTVLTFLVQVIDEALPSTTVLKLFLNMAVQATNIEGTEFHFLWLPVLRGLITSMEKHGKPLAAPRNQQLFAGFLEAYLKNYVGTEPSRERNLVRPTVRCTCRDCTWLNEFLRSAHQESGRFPMGKERRHHLHRQLDSLGIDCTHETERYGNPQTLIVSKTSRAQTQAIKGWETRRDNAKEQIKHFDQAKLREILGSDYEPIIRSFELGATTAPAGTSRQIAQAQAASEQLSQAPHSAAQPSQPVSAIIKEEGQPMDRPDSFLTPMSGNRGTSRPTNTPVSLAGTKRKIGGKEVEVIDLTGLDD